MNLLIPTGPFRPGDGGLPPYLAGRESEQAQFHSLLALLDRGEAPPSEVILYGPRGNGKTALLVWLKEVAAPSYAVDVIRLNPSKIRTGLQLAERLLPRSWWDAVASDKISFRGFTWRPGKDLPAPAADEALAARVSKRALVLLLDEAHTLEPEEGRELLNAAQEVGREAPLLVVLAGTPNLQAHLGTMGASFWDRSHPLPIGRLDESGAADAIRRPLESEALSISDEALAQILAASHGYPFFLQLWGAAVWNRVAQHPSSAHREITIEDAEACAAAFEFRRDHYYLRRHDELQKLRLLPAARAVAEVFGSRESVGDSELEAAVRRGLGPDADEDAVEAAVERFGDLGFIWRAGAMPDWEPGIPSLMDYIRQVVPAP